MANNNPFVPPELASILATLAQFAPPPTPAQNIQDPYREPPRSTIPPGFPTTENYVSQSHQQSYQQQQQQQQQPYAAPVSLDPRIRPQGRSTSTSIVEKIVIDPATITEWSAGLRCVSKIAAQNRLFGDTIRRVNILFPASKYTLLC